MMKTLFSPTPKQFENINNKIRNLKLNIVKGSKNIYKNHEHAELVSNYIENEV